MKKLLLIICFVSIINLAFSQVSGKEIGSIVCVKSNSVIYLIMNPAESYTKPSVLAVSKKQDVSNFLKDLKKAAAEDDESMVKWNNDIYTIEKNKSPKVTIYGRLSYPGIELSKKELSELIEWVSINQ